MTTYEGCSPNDAHIGFFWEIMAKKFDDMERAKFLKFVWGRSRLPVRAQDFSSKFKIQNQNKADCSPNPDAFMPIAHTCFFSIEVPRYSNIDVMHKRILWAITHCEAIDADHAANQIRVAEDDTDDEDDEGDGSV